uniref:Uncharacterized protein n=1 Tax=Anopheles atroparvus TaxID=41427 RepID=A0A182IW51_ANOAO
MLQDAVERVAVQDGLRGRTVVEVVRPYEVIVVGERLLVIADRRQLGPVPDWRKHRRQPDGWSDTGRRRSSRRRRRLALAAIFHVLPQQTAEAVEGERDGGNDGHQGHHDRDEIFVLLEDVLTFPLVRQVLRAAGRIVADACRRLQPQQELRVVAVAVDRVVGDVDRAEAVPGEHALVQPLEPVVAQAEVLQVEQPGERFLLQLGERLVGLNHHRFQVGVRLERGPLDAPKIEGALQLEVLQIGEPSERVGRQRFEVILSNRELFQPSQHAQGARWHPLESLRQGRERQRVNLVDQIAPEIQHQQFAQPHERPVRDGADFVMVQVQLLQFALVPERAVGDVEQFTSSLSSSQWHRCGQCSRLDDRSGTTSPSMKIHDTMSAISGDQISSAFVWKLGNFVHNGAPLRSGTGLVQNYSVQ